MATGITEIDGVPHLFREDGSAAAGWAELDGKKYHLDETGTIAQVFWMLMEKPISSGRMVPGYRMGFQWR